MITEKEEEAEEHARGNEKDGKYVAAAGNWEAIAENYERRGNPPDGDCCYLCEAARAYLDASGDWAKAGNTDNANADFDTAAGLFLLCGDRCLEAGDLPCADAGYEQADAMYAKAKKKAEASGNKIGAGKAKAGEEHARKGSRLIREIEKL